VQMRIAERKCDIEKLVQLMLSKNRGWQLSHGKARGSAASGKGTKNEVSPLSSMRSRPTKPGAGRERHSFRTGRAAGAGGLD